MPNGLPRVLHVIAPAPSGGAETVVRALAAAQRGLGAECQIAAVLQAGGESPFVHQARADGLTVSEIRCGRRQYLREGAEIAALARGRYDLIHSHVVHANFVALRAGRLAGLPVVSTAHGFTGGDWKNRFYDWADPLLLKRFDAVFAVSKALEDLLLRRGCDPGRVHLVPNAFRPGRMLARAEARRVLDLPAEGKVIGWLGRLTREKGPDLLLDALARLTTGGTTTMIIGEGPMLPELLAGATARGLGPGAVRFAGRRDGAASLLKAFDAIVLSSRTEGTPMALLEAIAAEVPVVSFAVGGIPQVLDERSGWLAPPLDTGALAAGLDQALATGPTAERRVKAALDLLRTRFSPDRWIDAINLVYRGVLARPRRA